MKPLNLSKAQYGKSETKRSIENVLKYIVPTYKYSSLAELNAVLQQYNIVADRGSENSRIYRSNGLVYRMLDVKGNKVGVPVKASLFYSKPTLKNLLPLFQKNEIEKQLNKRRVMNAVDLLLAKHTRLSLREFTRAVQKEKIHVVLRQNEKGIIYGITYVDYHTKCVFNGSQLGKQYSANGIQQRCKSDEQKLTNNHQPDQNQLLNKTGELHTPPAASKIFEDLIRPEENRYANEPVEQQKFRKRKRKQSIHRNE